MRLKRAGTLLTLLITCSSCAVGPSSIKGVPDPRDTAEYKALLPHSSIDFDLEKDIYFKSGHPAPGESLRTAVVSGAPQFSDLDTFLVVTLNTEHYGVAVFGYTDDYECDVHDCQALSQRRAKLVAEMLAQKGVPADRIRTPVGYGNSQPRYLRRADRDKNLQFERRVTLVVD